MEDTAKLLITTEPSNVQACHGSHTLRVCGIAIFEKSNKSMTYVCRVKEIFRLRKTGVFVQNTRDRRQYINRGMK